jgi:hypothetical protein
VPLLIVDDLHKYGDPVQVRQGVLRAAGLPAAARATPTAVFAALRKNITLGGVVATTTIAERRNVPLLIAEKTYRACRMTLIARQRRPR